MKKEVVTYRLYLLIALAVLAGCREQLSKHCSVVKKWAFECNDTASSIMNATAEWPDGSQVLKDGMEYHRLSTHELRLAEAYSYDFIEKWVMPPCDNFRITSRYFRQFLGYKKNGKLFVAANFYKCVTNTYMNDGNRCTTLPDTRETVINPYKKNTKDDDYCLLTINMSNGRVWKIAEASFSTATTEP